jgi:hypothetical protein
MDISQKAYLIGLICGKGYIYKNTHQVAIEFAHNNEFIDGIAHCEKCGYLATKSSGSDDLRCKNQECNSTVSADSKTRYEQQKSTRESVKNVISPFLTRNTKIRTSVNTIQTMSKVDDPVWYDNIVKVGREQLNEDRHASVPVNEDN